MQFIGAVAFDLGFRVLGLYKGLEERFRGYSN